MSKSVSGGFNNIDYDKNLRGLSYRTTVPTAPTVPTMNFFEQYDQGIKIWQNKNAWTYSTVHRSYDEPSEGETGVRDKTEKREAGRQAFCWEPAKCQHVPSN